MNKVRAFFHKHSSLIIVFVAFLVALVNYLVYPTFIKRQMELIEIPVANTAISSNTEITEEMVHMVSVTKNLLPEGIEMDKKKIIGHYLQSDFGVSKNGFFYSSSLTDKNKVLGSTYIQLNENESAYVVPVDEDKQPSEIFKSGQKIDLYYYTEIIQETGKNLLVGKLKENVRVLNVGVDTLTVAIEENEVSDFILAEQTGTIIPVVCQINDSASVYDIGGLRSYLNSENIAIRYEFN